MADGTPSMHLVVAYVAFHLFGYAGGTAFNSYYDRDEGPIGWLASPPPVPRRLLEFSLLWLFIGFGLAVWVGVVFASIYAIMFCLAVAYSHPVTRWKGRPLLALSTVALGQGVLACLGGWAAARGEIASALTSSGLVTIAAVTLITTGLYPLTEIYQLDEDERRGDYTAAIWLGPRNVFRFALVVMGGGAALTFVLISVRYGWFEAMLMGLIAAGIVAFVRRWSIRFNPDAVMSNFRTVMGLYAALSLSFIAWIGWHLFR